MARPASSAVPPHLAGRRFGGGVRFLAMAALAPSTQAMYRRAALAFVGWLDSVDEDPADFDDLDVLIEEYLHLHWLGKHGHGKGFAANTVNGIIKLLPEAKGFLPRSHAALKGFEKSQPKVSYPPLSKTVAVALAVKLATDGRYRAGLATLVGFSCLLRISELVGLRREDVADHRRDPRVDNDTRLMTLRLRATKTGPNQRVVVDDPVVADLLADAARRTRVGDFIFPFSAAAYRCLFKSACSAMGLSALYVPHSLRHGGATWLVARGHPVEEVMRRGRWASTRSARIYIQSGEASLLATQVPASVAAMGRAFMPILSAILALSQVG
jgi:integrase